MTCISRPKRIGRPRTVRSIRGPSPAVGAREQFTGGTGASTASSSSWVSSSPRLWSGESSTTPTSTQRCGLGRPRKRPDVLIADKGYAHDPTRRALRRRGIRHTIPERSDQVARRAAKGTKGGRPPTFNPEIYRERNVERCFQPPQTLARPVHPIRQTRQHLPRLPGPHRRHHLAPMIGRTRPRCVAADQSPSSSRERSSGSTFGGSG